MLFFYIFANKAYKPCNHENNQIPQKDISIRFNFGIASSANQEGTGESFMVQQS